MKKSSVIIFGATSAIVEAITKKMALRYPNCHFVLIARNLIHLKSVAADLRVRGSEVTTMPFETHDLQELWDLCQLLATQYFPCEVLLIGQGVSLETSDPFAPNRDDIGNVIACNYQSVVNIIQVLAPHFILQRSGTIAVISSVAGDRGRAGNFLYGSAKAAVTQYLQGLRQYLFAHHVGVVNIKPGFVDTPMTNHLRKNFLFAKPEKIAERCVTAIQSKQSTVYVPGFWRWIMTVIVLIPDFVFKRVRLG